MSDPNTSRERSSAGCSLPEELRLELLRSFAAPCFIALHGSVVWKNREPQDVDIMYVIDENHHGIQNRKVDKYDVTIITRLTFLKRLQMMDCQYLIFIWLPSEYVLSITDEFRIVLNGHANAIRKGPRCTQLLFKTNIAEIKHTWIKAKHALVVHKAYDKSMKYVFCAFRRAMLTQLVINEGFIEDFQVTNTWWTNIADIFTDSSFAEADVLCLWAYVEAKLAYYLQKEVGINPEKRKQRETQYPHCVICLEECTKTYVVFKKCRHVVHEDCLKYACLKKSRSDQIFSFCPQLRCNASLSFLAKTEELDIQCWKGNTILNRIIQLERRQHKLTSKDHIDALCERVTESVNDLEIFCIGGRRDKIYISLGYPSFLISKISMTHGKLLLMVRLEDEAFFISLLNGSDIFSIPARDILTYRSFQEEIARKCGISPCTIDFKTTNSIIDLDDLVNSLDVDKGEVMVEISLKKEIGTRLREELQNTENMLSAIQDEITPLRQEFEKRQKLKNKNVIAEAEKRSFNAKNRRCDPVMYEFKLRRAVYMTRQKVYHEDEKAYNTKNKCRLNLQASSKPRTRLRTRKSGKHTGSEIDKDCA